MSQTNEKNDEYNQKILELNNKIENIHNLLIEINDKNDKIIQSTSNMDLHIKLVI